ncbi:MAG TPA: S8 family serine peptidase [Terriglobia bacterium]|nr:S8 family serine peptidase [Terriglobia bacterium]
MLVKFGGRALPGSAPGRILILLAAALLLSRPVTPPTVHAQDSAPPFKHPKLSTVLAHLARAVPQERGPWPRGRQASMPPGFSMEAMPKAVRDAGRMGMMRLNARGEVQVYVLVTAADSAALTEITGAGAALEIVDAAQRIVQARVPVARLEAVGALPVVRFVTLPNYGVRRAGAVESEGDSIVEAADVRTTYRVDGTGVRVGVISDGLKGIFASCTAPGTGCSVSGAANGPIATGDLPSSSGTRNGSGTLVSVSGGITAKSFAANQDLEGLPTPPCGFPGAGAEGTALLEIIHDLAPGAQLFFANFDTTLAFQQAANYIAAHTDVGADDIGFFGLPYDGTSSVSANTAAALNNNSNPVRAWLTAVGNNARGHYQGNYVDSHTDGAAMVGHSGDLHQFQANSGTTDLLNLGPSVTDKIDLPPNAQAVIVLTWNDPFGGSNNDYDLYVVSESTGQVVASSTNPQSGSQDPVEIIFYTNPATSQEGLFDIVIQNSANKAAVRNLNLFLFTPECAQAPIAPIDPPNREIHNYNTAAGSVSAESDAGGSPASVVAVGAICSGVPKCPSYPDDPKHTQIEFFSSLGPTFDGRFKPNISAIDGVSITGAGQFENPFFGTSAATPHAAGVDALLLQLAPCLRSGASGALAPATARLDLYNLLLNNADPIGSPVPNNTYGYGRVDALAAAQLEVPTLSAPSPQTVSGGGGALQVAAQTPYGCPLTYNWTGSCGTGSGSTPAPACNPGPNTVTLSATNNGVTFTAATDIQVTATGFGVSASPASASVTAGKAATYTVTVTPQLGAFTNAVQLACSPAGLPAEATCSFSPLSVTPGSSPAASTLTLATTAASAAFGALRGPGAPGAFWRALGAMLLALLLAKLWGRVRWRTEIRGGMRPHAGFYRVSMLLGGLLLLAALAGCAACGGGGGTPSGPPPNKGTLPGTYTVTVTATAGQLSQSATVMLTVQ